MSYYEKTAQPGETVAHTGRLSWAIWFWPGLWALLFAMAASGALVGKDASLRGNAISYAIIAALILAARWATARAVELVVTDRRVIAKRGMLSRVAVDQRLARVERVDVAQGMFGTLCGYGTVIIRGTGGDAQAIKTVAQPLDFKRAVEAGLEAYELRRQDVRPAAPVSPDPAPSPEAVNRAPLAGAPAPSGVARVGPVGRGFARAGIVVAGCVVALVAALIAVGANTPATTATRAASPAAVQPAQDAEAQRLIAEINAEDGSCPWADGPQPPKCVREAADTKRLAALGYVFGEPWQSSCANDWHRKGSEPKPADMAAYQAHACEAHNATDAQAATAPAAAPTPAAAPVALSAAEEAQRVRDARDAITSSMGKCSDSVNAYEAGQPAVAMEACAASVDEIRRAASDLDREVHTPAAASVVAASDFCISSANEYIQGMADATAKNRDLNWRADAWNSHEYAASIEGRCFASLRPLNPTLSAN